MPDRKYRGLEISATKVPHYKYPDLKRWEASHPQWYLGGDGISVGVVVRAKTLKELKAAIRGLEVDIRGNHD